MNEDTEKLMAILVDSDGNKTVIPAEELLDYFENGTPIQSIPIPLELWEGTNLIIFN